MRGLSEKHKQAFVSYVNAKVKDNSVSLQTIADDMGISRHLLQSRITWLLGNGYLCKSPDYCGHFVSLKALGGILE